MASLLPAPHRLTMNNHNFMRINLTWSPPYNDNIYNKNLTWCPPWGFSYTWPSFATSSSAPSEPRSFCSHQSHQTKQWIHEQHTIFFSYSSHLLLVSDTWDGWTSPLWLPPNQSSLAPKSNPCLKVSIGLYKIVWVQEFTWTCAACLGGFPSHRLLW